MAQNLFRMSVCEDPVAETWKSGSVSEKAWVLVLRPGSVGLRMGLRRRAGVRRNWNWGC